MCCGPTTSALENLTLLSLLLGFEHAVPVEHLAPWGGFVGVRAEYVTEYGK